MGRSKQRPKKKNLQDIHKGQVPRTTKEDRLEKNSGDKQKPKKKILWDIQQSP